MIDHLLIYSTPEQHSVMVAYYASTLAPLGYKKALEMADGAVVGFGISGAPHADFWIVTTGLQGAATKVTMAHFAFTAKDQALVDECYARAIEAGGKDNGPPGLRSMYGEKYYGGFLFDPCGNNMEIVNRDGTNGK